MTRAGRVAVLALVIAAAGCPGPEQAGGQGGGATPAHGAGNDGVVPGRPAPQPAGPAPAAPAVDLTAVQDELLRTWAGAALGAPRETFVPAARSPELRDRLFRYLAQSSAATDLFLQPACDPHKQGASPTWTVRAAARPGELDLLRCDFASVEGKAVLFEGVNFVLLQLEPKRPLDQAGLQALLGRVVRLDLELGDGEPDRAWRFELPAGLDLSRGTHHFASRGAPPVAELEGRHQRADVIVREGTVSLVFWKKVDQLVGFQDGARWFDADARRSIGS